MPNPPASCVGVNPRGSSSSASGFPSCLREDPVADPPVQREPHRRAQQRAGITVDEAVHLEIRQVPKLLARLPCCEHEPHRLGQQPASDERERQRRGLIQPLRVVDDAEQGTLLGHLGDQAQHGQADEEPVRGGARAEPEHDLHGLTLWSRQPLEPIEQRCAQLMQARVGQLHLGLHPTARTTVRSDADSIRYSSSAVFPIPASPRRTSERLSPCRIAPTNPSTTGHPRTSADPALPHNKEL